MGPESACQAPHPALTTQKNMMNPRITESYGTVKAILTGHDSTQKLIFLFLLQGTTQTHQLIPCGLSESRRRNSGELIEKRKYTSQQHGVNED